MAFRPEKNTPVPALVGWLQSSKVVAGSAIITVQSLVIDRSPLKHNQEAALLGVVLREKAADLLWNQSSDAQAQGVGL
jgi:hypothetical protein